jgi:hypothetical protein
LVLEGLATYHELLLHVSNHLLKRGLLLGLLAKELFLLLELIGNSLLVGVEILLLPCKLLKHLSLLVILQIV